MLSDLEIKVGILTLSGGRISKDGLGMSFEAGLAAFKQNKFEAAIEQLLLYCHECDTSGKVTSQKYMQAHMGLAKSYQKLGQLDQAIAHCEGLAETQNPALKIWVDKMLPKFIAAAEKANAGPEAEASQSPAESEAPGGNAVASPSQPNEMLLQQGIQAYKNMKRDRAIKLLEDYIKDCTNHKSRNYMQAQMTLVKAYKETKQIPEAIARCEELSTTENFALKSWASKALPKLQKELGPSEEPAPEASASTTPTPSSAATPAAAASLTSKTGKLEQVSSSSFTFDALPHGVSRPSGSGGGSDRQPQSASTTVQSNSLSSDHSTLASPKTSPRRTSPSRSSRSAKSSQSPKQKNQGSGVGMGLLAGAVALLFGRSMGKRLVWKGVGLVIGLIVFVFRSCSGSFTPELSALQEAVITGDKVAVERLIDQGKSLETTDEYGGTIIFWALTADDCDADFSCQMSANQQEIVQLLLDNGADVNTTDTWQQTPLHLAAGIQDTTDILRKMIDRGASVRAMDSIQATPLHWAAESGSAANIELLLNREADVNAKDADGYTPLDYATSDAAVQMLTSRGGTSGF
ncbi:MAG: hypothetical protein F6K09_08290 [Merismopedia sp. SIO2A8]|nr:hypothetical protein [Symploca sp. SIO2B6]NET48711.1 hypothetical protein [Merismopedia sp. SIO2A8]